MNPTLTRRSLLGLLTGGLGWLASQPMAKAAKAAVKNVFASAGAPSGYDPTKHHWQMCMDVDRCIGCGSCVEACKTENRVPQSSPHQLGAACRCVDDREQASIALGH